MPQTISSPAQIVPSVPLVRMKLTVKQIEGLSTMGLLPDGKFELLDGDIVEKMPINYPHGFVQHALLFVLARLFGQNFILPPVSLWINDHNLPEPDVAVTHRPARTYLSQRYLRYSDVRLVVEIADATLSKDMTIKARLYAAAGIAEYWVLDVQGRRLLIHRSPGNDGYDDVTEYLENDTAAPLDAPNAAFTVAEILP